MVSERLFGVTLLHVHDRHAFSVNPLIMKIYFLPRLTTAPLYVRVYVHVHGDMVVSLFWSVVRRIWWAVVKFYGQSRSNATHSNRFIRHYRCLSRPPAEEALRIVCQLHCRRRDNEPRLDGQPVSSLMTTKIR